MIKRLKKRWKSLHQLIYVVAILAILHFVWLVKKDMTEPIIYGSVVGALLLMRIYFYYVNRNQSRTKREKMKIKASFIRWQVWSLQQRNTLLPINRT